MLITNHSNHRQIAPMLYRWPVLLQMADEPRLGYITDQLKSLSVSASAPPQLQVGALCLAQYSLDNEWYRASVQRVISSDPVNPQYAVIFLDFGNTDRVGGKNVRQIDSALAAVPAQAHSCCLAYLKVSQDSVYAVFCHNTCSSWVAESHETTFGQCDDHPVQMLLLLLWLCCWQPKHGCDCSTGSQRTAFSALVAIKAWLYSKEM